MKKILLLSAFLVGIGATSAQAWTVSDVPSSLNDKYDVAILKAHCVVKGNCQKEDRVIVLKKPVNVLIKSTGRYVQKNAGFRFSPSHVLTCDLNGECWDDREKWDLGN